VTRLSAQRRKKEKPRRGSVGSKSAKKRDAQKTKEEEEEEEEEHEGDGEKSISSTPGFAEWMQERKWTSDRARRIIQRHSERLLRNRLNISAWRHIAIAIANRYLNRAFGQDNGGGGDDDEDEDNIDDNVRDLQAGYGTHVAGMIYARGLQQGMSGTAARREQFRMISRQWHRFLGFGPRIGTE
jgi:hypothetical protein